MPSGVCALPGCFPDHLGHIFQHGLCHARIYAHPEGVPHNPVRIFQAAGAPVSPAALSHLIKTGVPCQIPRKQHSGLHAALFYIGNHPVSVCPLPAGKRKAKPAGNTVFTGLRQDKDILKIRKHIPQVSKIFPAPFHEGGKLFQLGAADRCLQIRCL